MYEREREGVREREREREREKEREHTRYDESKATSHRPCSAASTQNGGWMPC
jgi:hypothetical protein